MCLEESIIAPFNIWQDIHNKDTFTISHWTFFKNHDGLDALCTICGTSIAIHAIQYGSIDLVATCLSTPAAAAVRGIRNARYCAPLECAVYAQQQQQQQSTNIPMCFYATHMTMFLYVHLVHCGGDVRVSVLLNNIISDWHRLSTPFFEAQTETGLRFLCAVLERFEHSLPAKMPTYLAARCAMIRHQRLSLA